MHGYRFIMNVIIMLTPLTSLFANPPENFITVLTPAVYDYQYLPEVPVSKKSHVTFRVCAAADAHVALSMTYGDTKWTTYEVTLGSAGNSRSTVRYGARGPEVAAVDTPNLLAANDFKQFWISWNSMAIQVVKKRNVCRFLFHPFFF
jgi:Farnesoic acid 0-methyl transferase